MNLAMGLFSCESEQEAVRCRLSATVVDLGDCELDGRAGAVKHAVEEIALGSDPPASLMGLYRLRNKKRVAGDRREAPQP